MCPRGLTSLVCFRGQRNKPKLNTSLWAELSYEAYRFASKKQMLTSMHHCDFVVIIIRQKLINARIQKALQ